MSRFRRRRRRIVRGMMPIETRGGYIPQGVGPAPTSPPPKPSDSGRSAIPRWPSR